MRPVTHLWRKVSPGMKPQVPVQVAVQAAVAQGVAHFSWVEI